MPKLWQRRGTRAHGHSRVQVRSVCGIQERRCTRCLYWLTLEHYYRASNGRGYQSQCKPCQKGLTPKRAPKPRRPKALVKDLPARARAAAAVLARLGVVLDDTLAGELALIRARKALRCELPDLTAEQLELALLNAAGRAA